MSLIEKCRLENYAWQNGFVTAYYFTEENGQIKTVFDYQVPLPKDMELGLCARYNISKDKLREFYRSYLLCIQNEYSVSSYLAAKGVNSILTFSKVEQTQDENKVSHLLMETEQVWPIMEKLFVDSIPAVSVIDVFLRLSIVLRDIGKDPVNVVHRGVDLNEVYINSKDKILMGGFFYSQCQGTERLPYLPCEPANLPTVYQNGEIGCQGTDIQMLVAAAWNVFSGIPHDATLSLERFAKPEFAPPELADILLPAIKGLPDDAQCNAFRRSLLTCRNSLKKTEFANLQIPIRKQPIMEFKVDFV